MEDQMNAMHRSQGLLDDDSANRIGPSVPKPTTTTYSSTAKTIQKPPQLSGLVAKPMVSMAAPPQRTIIATPIRPGMQQVTILPQATHAMVAMPSMVAVAPQPPLHPPPMIDEPSAKRSKTEDQLIPEEEFYKTFGRVRKQFINHLISIRFISRVKLRLQFNYQSFQKNLNGILMVKLFH